MKTPVSFRTRVRRLFRRTPRLTATVARVYKDGKHVADLVLSPES